MKLCNKCQIERNETEFFKDKGFKDGLRSTCKICDKAKNMKWRVNNREYHNALSRKWHTENKELCVKRASLWNKANPEKVRVQASQYKKHVRIATPEWVDIRPIKEFYKNRPAGYHVDHIIPLRGENVSGLHVLWNLQYLPASDNMAKSNKVQ